MEDIHEDKGTTMEATLTTTTTPTTIPPRLLEENKRLKNDHGSQWFKPSVIHKTSINAKLVVEKKRILLDLIWF